MTEKFTSLIPGFPRRAVQGPCVAGGQQSSLNRAMQRLLGKMERVGINARTRKDLVTAELALFG